MLLLSMIVSVFVMMVVICMLVDSYSVNWFSRLLWCLVLGMKLIECILISLLVFLLEFVDMG